MVDAKVFIRNTRRYDDYIQDDGPWIIRSSIFTMHTHDASCLLTLVSVEFQAP